MHDPKILASPDDKSISERLDRIKALVKESKMASDKLISDLLEERNREAIQSLKDKKSRA